MSQSVAIYKEQQSQAKINLKRRVVLEEKWDSNIFLNSANTYWKNTYGASIVLRELLSTVMNTKSPLSSRGDNIGTQISMYEKEHAGRERRHKRQMKKSAF